MKEILIQYDETDDIQVKYDPEDIRETLNVLLMTFRGLLYQMCKEDKEMLYLIILESIDTLRKEPKVELPQEVKVGKEEEETKEV